MMKMKNVLLCSLVFVLSHVGYGQSSNAEKDSVFIHQFEEGHEPVKVLHAEPLFIDLIRDLGARKGEKEWNVGLGLTDNVEYDAYEALVEYEWAPVNRLGFEIELPFTFYSPVNGRGADSVPYNELNSIKLATQWSFFVNEPGAISMAIGYINEFELSNFGNFGDPLVKGNVYNPFYVIAKRWGNNFHTLIYTGPMIHQDFASHTVHTTYDINTNFHYMIPGTRNFMGVEFNKTIHNGDFDMTIRPQMRLDVSDELLIGIVVGIPVSRENENLSSFIRLIWEPGHSKTK